MKQQDELESVEVKPMNEKKKLLWNSIIYAFKSVLGILFPLITFPYVSNVLGPSVIGKVEYANSITNYFIYLAALGITTYAIREGAKVKDNREALSKLSEELLIINSVSTVVAYIGILIVCKIPIFSQYAGLILINSLIILFQTIGMEWIYNVKEDFTYITIRYIVMQILAIVFLFVFVKTISDYYFYAVYIVLTTCGSNVVNVFCVGKYVDVFKRRKLDIKKHLKPILLLFSISITATIFANLDTTMLGILSSEFEVGIYHAGLKIDKITTNILASISLVVFSRSSYLLKDGDLSENGGFKKLIKQFNGVMMLIAMPITMGLLSAGSNIIRVFLSEEYAKAGIVLSIISVNVLMSAIGRIYGQQILIGTNHDSQYFFSTVLALVIDMALNFLLIPRLGAVATAISTVLACLISNIYVIFCASKLINVLELVFTVFKYFVLCLPFPVISWAINRFNLPQLVLLMLIMFGCGVYYFVILLVTKDQYLYQIIQIFKKGDV